MYLVYHPAGSEEPTRFRYQPNKLMSVEREALEKLTSLDFSEFAKKVIAGNSLCRRALLFVFLKREHPTTRFADVDFAWDELQLEFTKGELAKIREVMADQMDGDELAQAQARIDEQIAEAPDDDDEGKVSLPIVA